VDMPADSQARIAVRANPRIAIVGDSLASGLGVREPYGRQLGKLVGAEKVLMKAKASRMVDECTALVERLEAFQPDLVLISTGQTEGAIHPPQWAKDLISRHGPAGWQGEAGLDPRAVYSADAATARRERASTFVKVLLKYAMIKFGGGRPRMDYAEYRLKLREFLDVMGDKGWPVMVAGVGMPPQLYFPGSRKSLTTIDRIQREEIAGRSGVVLLRTDEFVDMKVDVLADHVHPTVKGHGDLARAHLARIELVPREDVVLAADGAPEQA
jgi:hypothetical protein